MNRTQTAEHAAEYEFEVWQNGSMEAGGAMTSATAAMAEADHYALMYGQDGPVELRFYIRNRLTRSDMEDAAEVEP